MPRSRMLWSAEPVKWMRYVPASPGGMTMRSTCGPRRTVTAAFACPAPRTWSTTPRCVNRSTTVFASAVSTSRSRSPIDSRRRRSEPAWTIRVTPGTPRSCSARSSLAACARWMRSRRGRRLELLDPLEDALLGARRDALEGPQALFLRRLLEARQVRDPERLPHDPHGLGPDAGDPQQVDERAGDLCPQLLVVRHVAGRGELEDLVGDRLADAGDRASLAGRVRRPDVERRPGDRVRGPVVGDGLEHELALDLEDVADLVEDPRELAVGDGTRRLGLVAVLVVARRLVVERRIRGRGGNLASRHGVSVARAAAWPGVRRAPVTRRRPGRGRRASRGRAPGPPRRSRPRAAGPATTRRRRPPTPRRPARRCCAG